MRAWAGWVAAALLVALAFAGGPDAVDLAVAGGATPAATAEQRGAHVRDDGIDLRHRGADQRAPAHPRLLALPPSPKTAVPAPPGGAVPAAHATSPSAVTERGRPPRSGACTPEVLQIFRC